MYVFPYMHMQMCMCMHMHMHMHMHMYLTCQAAWVEQVGAMPAAKRDAAFDALQRETGLGREELGLPPQAVEAKGEL